MLIVVIVGSETAYAIAREEHIVVFLVVLLGVAEAYATVVADLHSVHTVILGIAGIVLLRPSGMIVCNEKSRLFYTRDALVDRLGRVFGLELGLVGKICLVLILVEMLAVEPAHLLYVIGIFCDKAHMANALNVADRMYLGLGKRDLPTVEGEKFIVRKLGVVGDENIVIGVGNYRISRIFIELLNLLRSQTSVRQYGVKMKTCLVEMTRFGQKILFHFDSSKIFAASKKTCGIVLFRIFGGIFSFLFRIYNDLYL